MTLQTDRLRLPLLAAAQAQKEMTHNEALALLDAVVQPDVVAVGLSAPPASPSAGQAWIIGPTPSGEWTGNGGALAIWTAGGWRFVAAFEAMAVWSMSDAMTFRRSGGSWVGGGLTGRTLALNGVQVVGARGSSIASPSSGAVIDIEGRAAISAMLSALRTHGLIAT